MNYQLLFSSHHFVGYYSTFSIFFSISPPFTGYDTQIIHPSSLFVVSLFFKSFRILNCHAFDSAEMKIGQMKKVPLGLWREKLSKLQGILCESGIYFFLHHFVSCFWELQKEQQISQTYQAFLRGSETRQEILHANISKTKFSFVISFSLSLSCLLRVYLRQTIVWQLCCSKYK